MRALYTRLLDEPAVVQAAFALDSVSTQVIFVTGPLLVAGLIAVLEPAAALATSAVIVLIGVSAFLAAMPASERRRAPHADPSARPVGRLGALRSPGIRTIVLTMVPVGFALGSIEVALPAFADAEGSHELAGVLLALWSLGSAIGGLVYGARARRSSLVGVHVRMALLLPLGVAPLALAGSPLLMAVLVIPAGLFVAPLIATRNELAGLVAPRGAETEAFTWPLTALVSGVSLGSAAAGALVDGFDWRVPLVIGACTAALGAVVLLVRRRTLEVAPASTAA
jgi:predicted MFS family arabinose efflux permease